MASSSEELLDLIDLKGRLILREDIDIDFRTIQLNGVITNKSANKLNRALTFLEGVHKDPITIVINSPGGSIYDALSIIDRIQNSRCEVITVGTGLVASAAVPILASGDVRKATRFTSFMYHEASISLPFDRVSTVDAELKHTKHIEQRINRFMAEVTGKSYTFWASCGKHVDHYFDSEKALELGLIQEIEDGVYE